MSHVTRSHPLRSRAAAAIIGLIGLAAPAHAGNISSEQAPLNQAPAVLCQLASVLELGFSLDFEGVGAEGTDNIWRGQLAGSVGGEVMIRLELRTPASESPRPVWPVHAFVFVASDDAARSFVAELDGTMDWRSGSMRLSGVVTDGWMAGAPIGGSGQIDPVRLDGDGTLRIGSMDVASTSR